MFVADEILVDASFSDAQARLANLAHGDSLTSASKRAYGDGLAGLMRAGPPGTSELAEVFSRDLVSHDAAAVLTLRWQATGPGGRLFPALDADITLTPAGEHGTRLSLAGACRSPLAAPGAGLDKATFHQAAATTIRSFLDRVGEILTRSDAVADWVPGAGASRSARHLAVVEPP
jgi:hypothetical protein